MALVPAVISDGFAGMVENNPGSAQDAASQFAAIYQAYALVAQAGAFPPVYTGLEVLRYASILYAEFKNLSGTPVTAATAFVAAMTSFWMAPPVLFGAGAVTAFPGAPVLQTTLESLFSGPNDKQVVAEGLAEALDTATKTVTVTIGITVFTLL
jgi:hypothetical protein